MKRGIISGLILCSLLFVLPMWAQERAECANPASDLFYFPRGLLEDSTAEFDIDTFVRTWYSKYLRVMAEPSLSCKEPTHETYRFTWLRTFHSPVAVRIEFDRGTATLYAVKLDGAGGYAPGKLKQRDHRPLSEEESVRLLGAIKAMNFWRMGVRRGDNGRDGAQWILEGRKGAEYRVVHRWSPESGVYREFCISLLKLAGMVKEDGTELDPKDPIY